MFVLGQEAQCPAELLGELEHGGRQAAFRDSLAECGITIKTITNPDDLRAELYQALVRPDRGAVEVVAGWRGRVAVPPLRGDEVERPGLMAI
jgi:hypothetical protein